GMTMRPEPLTAVLVMGVMVCIVLHLERGTTAPIAFAAVLVVLALSSHHAGVVSFAPLLVAAPPLARWARARVAVATTIAASTSALLATLLFVGSDLEQRRLDAQITRLYGATETWRDEIARYALLSEQDYGTSLRRLSVVLIALAVASFVLRARRARRGLLDFPAAVLAAGMVLLVLTPSKWPSHFGALLGVAAVAFAAEAARLRAEAARQRSWRAWPFVALGAATAATAWSWWTREQWNVIDLRTLEWFPGFESRFPLSQLATLLPLLVLAAAIVVALARGRRDRLPALPWSVAALTGPLIAVPVIAFGVGVLVADAAKTDGWTLTRQNLESVLGDPACGLAEELVIPVRSSARALVAAQPAGERRTPSWAPPPPVASLPRHALGPTGEDSASTGWFVLPGDGRFGLYVAGTPGPADGLVLDWGRRTGGGVELLSSDAVAANTGVLTGTSPWRFFATGDLPAPAPNASFVRVTLRSDSMPGSAVAVTAPVTYANEELARRMDRASPTLVLPNLVTYFPCADLPVLGDGVVEVPHHVLVSSNPHSAIRYPISSPFAGLVDVYELERLPISDSTNPPDELFAFEVDRRIPGGKELPPDSAKVTS
ncbi:MAG: arabinosyltransferase domain-containing protein, partial [Gaiellaceae bacterium]